MKIKSHSLLCVLATIALSSPLIAMGVNAQKAASHTWNPNVKSGMYRNPVIDADYSDPDVCRVGNDYYMTSQFTRSVLCRICKPGKHWKEEEVI